MPFPLEYDCNVVRSIHRSLAASLALSGLFLVLLVSASSAQFNAAGAGHAVSVAPPTRFAATPPTGAITPPTGPVAPPTAGFAHNYPQSTVSVHTGNGPHSSGVSHHGNGNNHPHHTANGTAYYPYVYALPVPYAVDMSATDDSTDVTDDDAAEYQGGPTIFDRRGSGQDSYVAPIYEGPAHAPDPSQASFASDPDPEPPQPPTTLVFKDGHQVEVSNYAIVSQTLYDLTPGHQRKIALAELDLPATEKQNDDHGVVFQLPPSAQAN